MTVRPPCFVSLPCGSRSRNWAGSPFVRRRNLRRPAPVCSAPPLPEGPCPVCPRLEQEFEPFRSGRLLEGHAPPRPRARGPAPGRDRPAPGSAPTPRAAALRAQDRDAAATVPPAPDCPTPTRRRSGRAASSAAGPGPKRRDYSHLPAVVEDHGPPDRPMPRCSRCGQPFAAFPGTEDSIILEIDVRAHRRVIHRRRYRPTCACGAHPGIVTAPPPPRLIPKSILGVSIWVTILLDKYLFYRPTYRLLADWDTLRPGPVAGDDHRRPEAPGAAARADLRGAW